MGWNRGWVVLGVILFYFAGLICGAEWKNGDRVEIHHPNCFLKISSEHTTKLECQQSVSSLSNGFYLSYSNKNGTEVVLQVADKTGFLSTENGNLTVISLDEWIKKSFGFNLVPSETGWFISSGNKCLSTDLTFKTCNFQDSFQNWEISIKHVDPYKNRFSSAAAGFFDAFKNMFHSKKYIWKIWGSFGDLLSSFFRWFLHGCSLTRPTQSALSFTINDFSAFQFGSSSEEDVVQVSPNLDRLSYSLDFSGSAHHHHYPVRFDRQRSHVVHKSMKDVNGSTIHFDLSVYPFHSRSTPGGVVTHRFSPQRTFPILKSMYFGKMEKDETSTFLCVSNNNGVNWILVEENEDEDDENNYHYDSSCRLLTFNIFDESKNLFYIGVITEEEEKKQDLQLEPSNSENLSSRRPHSNLDSLLCIDTDGTMSIRKNKNLPLASCLYRWKNVYSYPLSIIASLLIAILMSFYVLFLCTACVCWDWSFGKCRAWNSLISHILQCTKDIISEGSYLHDLLSRLFCLPPVPPERGGKFRKRCGICCCVSCGSISVMILVLGHGMSTVVLLFGNLYSMMNPAVPFFLWCGSWLFLFFLGGSVCLCFFGSGLWTISGLCVVPYEHRGLCLLLSGLGLCVTVPLHSLLPPVVAVLLLCFFVGIGSVLCCLGIYEAVKRAPSRGLNIQYEPLAGDDFPDDNAYRLLGTDTFQFPFSDGTASAVPSRRICPRVGCNTVNLRADRACKHTICQACSKWYCHSCLRIPNGSGKGAYEGGVIWDCGTGPANAFVRCPQRDGTRDENLGGVFPIQTKDNSNRWRCGVDE